MTDLTPRGPRLLLVEDDEQLAGMLAELFTGEGYVVEYAPDGQRALHLLLTRAYDVAVLDRGLPAIDGMDVLSRVRGRGVTTPVLVLSALANVSDRVDGLDAGAEDYLGKPFDLEELLARVRALLRRHTDAATVLPVPGGRLEVTNRTVWLHDRREVTLSPREADLLALLARRPRQVFSRDDLLNAVFDGSDDSGVVETYVHYLRRKLGREAVRTVRGIGYRLGATSEPEG